MVPITAWRSLAAALLAAVTVGCAEEVAAPGRCPELCPADSLGVDTITINAVVAYDTSVRGYTRLDRSPVMVASSLPAFTSYAVIRFTPLAQRWFPIPNDTAGVSIGVIESVTIDIRLEDRDTSVDGNGLNVYLLPPSRVDTLMTFDSIAPYFTTPIDLISIPDSVTSGNLHKVLPVGPMTPLEADSFRIALGFEVTASSPTAAILGAFELGTSAVVRYYVRGAAPRDTFRTALPIAPFYDTYVRNPPAIDPPPSTIVVGDQPASRAFLRFDIPSYYVDSVTILRATLKLNLEQPVQGFPGEVYRVQAIPLLRFFGGKSIIFPDTSGVTGAADIPVGSTGTANIEIGRILRVWRGINPDSLPRAITLRSTAEEFTFAQIEASGSGSATPPSLTLTFVRPFRFGVP